MLWAVGMHCHERKDEIKNGFHMINITNTVNAFVVEAANKYEAEGKAMRIAQKLYPQRDGFKDHFVKVHDASIVVEPETVTLTPNED